MHRFFYSFWIGFGLWTVSGNFLPIFGEELRNLPEARIPLDEGKNWNQANLLKKKKVGM